MTKKPLPALLLLVLTLGCESPPRSMAAPEASGVGRGGGPAATTLYQHAGSRQCSGGGKSIESAQRELAAAGIEVLSAQCGNDGRMYAATCGNPDGAILVVKVPRDQAERASRMGWKALSELPEATTKACR